MRKKQPDAPDTRQRILKTAERLFAEKGFDGARVDEIAAGAGVNKALIYYYFESKEKILDELLSGFQKMIAEVTLKAGGKLELDQVTTDQLLDHMLAYLESHEDLLRILISEVLKDGRWGGIVFQFLERILQTAASEMKRMGAPVPDGEMLRVGEFFTGVVPIVFYTILAQRWSERFRVDRDALRAYFKRAIRASHVDYWKRLGE